MFHFPEGKMYTRMQLPRLRRKRKMVASVEIRKILGETAKVAYFRHGGCRYMTASVNF
jgi:hypothetical protein